MRHSTLILILATMTALAGCNRLPGLSQNETPRVGDAYERYRLAMVTADRAALQRLLAKEKLAELNAPDFGEKLRIAAALYPPHVTTTAVEINGPKATLKVSGTVDQGNAQGTIQLVKEDGEWKVLDESWNIKLEFSDADASVRPTMPTTDVSRPDSTTYLNLRGQWLGPDVATGVEWTFSFGDDFATTIRSANQWYEGLAAFHAELGAEKDGSLRVAPGSGILDVDVLDGSSPEFKGKTSLGAYYQESPTELKLCASRPGVRIRVQSFDRSTNDVHCFRLTKISDAPVAGRFAATSTDVAPPAADYPSPLPRSVPAASAPPSSASPSRPAFGLVPNGDATGEALVVMDGASSQYVLKTSYGHETRFKDPRNATIQFQPSGIEPSNLMSGLLITLDVTQVGRHYADAAPTTTIGQKGPDGRGTEVRWIAPGGQIFPVKTGCVIDVTSAYTGTAASVLSGEISNCTLFSAGIDHVLSSVRFTMKGRSSR